LPASALDNQRSDGAVSKHRRSFCNGKMYGAASPDTSSQAAPRQFPDVLLTDPDLAFLIARNAENQLVDIALANRDDDVIGLSNVFGTSADATEIWSGASSTAIEIFQNGHSLTGYGSSSRLQQLAPLGFDSIGPMRVFGLAPLQHQV
jgi:hypothetical protein